MERYVSQVCECVFMHVCNCEDVWGKGQVLSLLQPLDPEEDFMKTLHASCC